MEDYNRTRKQKSIIVKIIWSLFVLVAFCTAVGTATSYFAPFVNPYTFWYVSFLGLGGQLLMVANLVFLLILVIRLSKWAFIPLIVAISGIGFWGEFLQVDILTKYSADEKPSRSEVKILSFNVHGFYEIGSTVNYSANLDSIISYVVSENPDIVCIQEFQLIDKKDHSAIDAQMAQWQYRAMSYVVDDNYHKWGLAVFSKLPLKNANAIRFTHRENSSMYVDVTLNDSTFRLFNNHLQSTQFNTINREQLLTEDPKIAAHRVGSTLRDNYRIRAFQADTIASIIARSPYPTVVVGDFNDTPMSYVYHTIRGKMRDSFCEKGNGYEYTYKPLKRLFRIDYILHSSQFETVSHSSPYTIWSDHKPVISRIKLKTN